jgi:hypothetical protein
MSVAVIAVLVIVAAIVVFALLRRGEILRFETSAQPQEIINAAVSLVGTKRRWSTLATSESSVTFAYHKKPAKLLALIFLLMFIIPGIVYLALAGKRESLAVSATPQAQGTVVQVTSNGSRGKSAGRALRAQLGVSPQTATSEPAQA